MNEYLNQAIERGYLPVKDIARLFSKLRANGDCVEWTAGKNADGYGYIKVNRFNWRVHRLMYILLNGDIPNNLVVCHKCDNRVCCNPNHLFLGSVTDNNSDRANKDRNRNQNGSGNNMSKLTESQVIMIRASSKSKYDLAIELGVTPATIMDIRKFRRWKHLK